MAPAIRRAAKLLDFIFIIFPRRAPKPATAATLGQPTRRFSIQIKRMKPEIRFILVSVHVNHRL
jgi:hypothetical protein